MTKRDKADLCNLRKSNGFPCSGCVLFDKCKADSSKGLKPLTSESNSKVKFQSKTDRR